MTTPPDPGISTPEVIDRIWREALDEARREAPDRLRRALRRLRRLTR